METEHASCQMVLLFLHGFPVTPMVTNNNEINWVGGGGGGEKVILFYHPHRETETSLIIVVHQLTNWGWSCGHDWISCRFLTRGMHFVCFIVSLQLLSDSVTTWTTGWPCAATVGQPLWRDGEGGGGEGPAESNNGLQLELATGRAVILCCLIIPFPLRDWFSTSSCLPLCCWWSSGRVPLEPISLTSVTRIFLRIIQNNYRSSSVPSDTSARSSFASAAAATLHLKVTHSRRGEGGIGGFYHLTVNYSGINNRATVWQVRTMANSANLFRCRRMRDKQQYRSFIIGTTLGRWCWWCYKEQQQHFEGKWNAFKLDREFQFLCPLRGQFSIVSSGIVSSCTTTLCPAVGVD